MGTICIETSTGLVKEWARNGTPASYNAATDTLIQSDAPPPDNNKWANGAWTALPAAPKVKEFEGALKVIYANNLVALNTLMAKYPLFLWSLRDENWAYVKAMFQAAVGAGDITANDWTSIQAAATDKNIPIL